MVDGVPALFINGQPASQMAAAPYQQGTNDYNYFLRAGIQIYNIYFRFPGRGRRRTIFRGWMRGWMRI